MSSSPFRAPRPCGSRETCSASTGRKTSSAERAMKPDAERPPVRATIFLVMLAAVLPGASCEVVKPSVKASSDVPSAGKFPHGLLGRLLEKAVTDGLVDYAAVSSSAERRLGEAAC